MCILSLLQLILTLSSEMIFRIRYCTVVEKRNAAKECFSSHVRLDISELLAWYFAREGFFLPFRIFKFGGKGRVCSESGSRHGLSTVQ